MKIKSLIARGLLCPLFAFAVLTASAAPIPIQLQPIPNPSQYGSIDPSYAWLNLEESQTFTAIPKVGYRFDRWEYSTSDSNAVQVDGSKITITNTLTFDPTLANTFMANFVLGSYKITFDPGDGGTTSSLSVTNETERKEYGGYPAFPSPTRDGYEFTGWTTNGVAWTVKQGDRIWLTENVTAVAGWEAKLYTVTYKVNNGSEKYFNKSIVFGKNYELPNPDPTWTGHTFEGWYTEPAGGTEIDSYTTMERAEPHCLYAHWTAAKYTVSFDLGDEGEVSPTSISVEYDSPYGKLPTPKRDGFDFVGWYTASSGGLPVTAETKVSTAGDHTLYAHWKGASYQIATKMFDGCTLTVDKDGVFGNALLLSWTAGQKTGYTATNTIVVVSATEGGVELAKYMGTTASGHESYMMTGKYYSSITISVTSSFKPNSYRVSFDSQGGSFVNPKDVTYDASYGELSVPTRTGYDFVGWFTAAEGGVEIKADTKVAITGQQTLYAHWTAKTYAVEKEIVGNVSLDVAETGTFDQSLVIAWTVGEKTGYAVKLEKVEIFANESGSGKLLGTYTSGDRTEFKMAGDYYSGIIIKATASQTPNSYTVKFDANGARGKMDSIICTYDKSFDLPKQNSYTSLTAKFLGWSRDPKATVPEWADEAKGIKNLTDVDGGEVTLYAVWQDLQNELTRAAHGKNVILETTGEVPFHAYTNAVGQTFAQSGNWSLSPSCTMSVTVSGPGIFSFVWKREPSESGNFLLSIEKENPSNISDARWGGIGSADGWTRVTKNFTGAGDHQVIWYSVADDYHQEYLLVDQVEWQPAGWVDEPTEADRRDISAVTMASGELVISFENADSRFAYSLHGTNDLTAARSLWPVLFTTNDTGRITIKPEVKTDEKQFFYYLEVHSK